MEKEIEYDVQGGLYEVVHYDISLMWPLTTDKDSIWDIICKDAISRLKVLDQNLIGTKLRREIHILTGVGGLKYVGDQGLTQGAGFYIDEKHQDMVVSVSHIPFLDNMLYNGDLKHPSTGIPVSSYELQISIMGRLWRIYKPFPEYERYLHLNQTKSND